ncbi:DUF1761 family protein [Oceanicola sp. S124]|uniref:DUF1761 family protein n=1 Tax=Oceanicola sp. S124 TaxID=1042378 RepID=UPI00025596BC|nr:DUF1761 family protein [Oceanicola sp. S124]
MVVLPVILAAVADFAAGIAWYMSHSSPWTKAAGIACVETGKPVNAGPMPLVIGVVTMLLVAGMMRHMLAMAGKSPLVGRGVGVFFITPWMAMNNACAQRL